MKFSIEQSLLGLNEEILNSTTEGILLINHETREVDKYNSRFLEMWRVPKELAEQKEDEKLIDHVLDQLQSPDDFISLIERLYTSPNEDSYDVLDFVDGRVFERFSTPLKINDKVKGRLWFFRDVTEKKELENTLSHTARLAAIGQLAAGVGHEINNPLSIIKGYVESIRSQELSIKGDVIDKLNKIDIASDRIAKIVAGLRTFARIDADNLQESFVAKDLLSELNGMLGEIYQKDGVQLKFDIESLREESIKGDRGRFEQVLVNLLGNAKDAISGQKKKVISVEAILLNGLLEISINDNGPGVSYEIKDKIFNPFFTTKEIGKGTGMGLSLSHKYILNEFDGTLVVKDSDLGGAKFVISVPFYNEQQDETEKEKEIELNIDELNFNMNVLLVDDEPDLLDILEIFFEDFGVDVTKAYNGKEAYEILINDSNHFDLVVSDMQMPEMNGIALAKNLRKNEKFSNLKIVFSTGNVDFNLDELKDYINGYIYKPFTPESIAEKLLELFPNKLNIKVA